MEARVRRKRVILIGVSLGVVAVLALTGWQGVRALWAWRGIERIEFDTAEARQNLAPLAESEPVAEADPVLESTPVPTFQATEYDTVLAIGSDSQEGTDRDSVYADAILFWLAPLNGGDPVLASLPRDLLVVDPCTGEPTKLDRTLLGCGDSVSGPELVALAVEDYTGIGVDHFATFGFEAFVDVIDSLGGVDVCVDNALRQGSLELLPAGCSAIDGTTALRWVTSRTTQEFVDDEWQFVEGVSDNSRSQRQQQLMFAMLAKMKTMRSPAALAGIAESVGDSVVLSQSLSMGEAVAMAWDVRSVPASRIRRIVVPTEPVLMTDGSFALRGVVPFSELLEG